MLTMCGWAPRCHESDSSADAGKSGPYYLHCHCRPVQSSCHEARRNDKNSLWTVSAPSVGSVAENQLKLNLYFSLKMWHLVATILIILPRVKLSSFTIISTVLPIPGQLIVPDCFCPACGHKPVIPGQFWAFRNSWSPYWQHSCT